MKGSKREVRPGVWRLRVYVGRKPNGTPIQATRTFHGGSRAADGELRKLVEKVERSRSPERQSTIEGLMAEWVESLRVRRKSPTTIEAYEAYIRRRVNPLLGSVRIERLTARDLDRAYATWLEDGLSPTTVHTLHKMLSAALNQAVKWEWLDRAPTEKASPPSRAPGITRSITTKELAKLIRAAQAVNEPLAMAISLAAVTGARRGELCALRWSDLKGNTLSISRSVAILKGGEVHVGQTKTHQSRKLLLDDSALRALDAWRGWQKANAKDAGVRMARDPHILTPVERPSGENPYLPHTLSHQFSKLCKQLKLPYHFHELRHFAATMMISSGVDVKMASARLGHSKTHTTLNIYAHAVEAADHQAAAVLGAAVFPALGKG